MSDPAIIRERLSALRKRLAEEGYSGCLITSDDYHMSEFTSPHFQSRTYFSGFDGSAGTLVVLLEEAGLWTDGRYFLQAEEQLADTGITLYRMGQPGTPLIPAFLKARLPEGSVFAVDGRTLSAKEGVALETKLNEIDVSLFAAFDPAEGIWQDRPPLPKDPVWILEEQYAGRPAKEKLETFREDLDLAAGDCFYLTKLDEICWLLNLRGSDVPYNPVFLAFLAVTRKEAVLYIDEDKLNREVKDYLTGIGVRTAPYDRVYEDAEKADLDLVIIDPESINYRLDDALFMGAAGIDEDDSPAMLRKAVKNETEIENSREIHIEDGVAMVRFMKWLKEQMAEGIPQTELSAAKYLDELRYGIEGNLGLSFPTISGYGPHGAVIHYEPTEESDIPLEPHGFLLVDSGGQYLKGTTDITRTFALGPLTGEEKAHFALVLRCQLALQSARFPKGLWFENLDVLARLPLWEQGLDFNHGTGHGVGSLLNVHEGPNRFYWRPLAGRAPTEILPGMITTDEPGFYREGSHGIRLENELLCVADGATEWGDFLAFEPLTLCPIDRDAVDASLLNETELSRLNAYHALVYEKLAPRLTEEERAWLAEYTRPITK